MTEPQTDQGRWLLDHQGLVNISKPADRSMRGDEIDLRASVLTIEAESRNATLDEVVRVVEGLESPWPLALPRAAVLDAVKALQSPERDQG